MIAQLSKEYISTRPSKLISRLISYFFFEGRPATTKGRWINPFLFFVFKIISIFPQAKKIKSPIFIIGTGRSGSTLLGMLLSMHKKIGFLNEPKAMWHFAFNNEDVIGSYSTVEAKYKLDASNVNDKGVHLIKKLYGFYLASVFSSRIVDKYPELIFRIEFVKEIFPDAKFLFLQRNGFNTCISTEEWIRKHRVVNNNQTEDWWGVNNRKWKLLLEQIVPSSKLLSPHLEKIKVLQSQVDMAAIEWIAAMEEGIYFQKKYPESILPVKYETIIEDPEKGLSEILTFCNLDFDNAPKNYAKKILKKRKQNETDVVVKPFLKECIHNLMSELGY